ncbi:MAG TPA: tripartite tricarboxylate transporter substrate binding protein [Bordetella sp.]
MISDVVSSLTRPSRRHVGKALLALGLAAALPGMAMAEDAYPSHPVTIVVPFPPGGATDISARIVAEGLSKKWNQSVIVVNKPGAGGNVGSEYVAHTKPDGYTLLLGVTGSHGINVSLYPNLPYDPIKDFTPLTMATLYPNAIAVNPSVPAKNLQELIALLKKDGNKYSYGSDGNGTASHLGLEILKQRGQFPITHVPYKGSAPMLTDLMAGQIQVGITGLPAILPGAQSGKLRLIAITTADRFPGLDYPTVAEQGFPGYAAAPWSGFFAPKGLSPELTAKISADMREVMSDPEAQKKILTVGSQFVPSTPEAFHDFLVDEIKKWGDAVKISGAKID